MGEKSCFFPNLSSYNIRFQFQIIDLVNFNFNFGFHDFLAWKFLSDSLVDFFVNLDTNSAIFDYVDSPSSYLSKYIKNPNFSPHFIVRFDQISNN